MATNLPGNTCVGEHSVCLLRAAKLDTDCSPLGTTDSAIITTGIVTMTATPEIEEGLLFEPKNGCGTIGWRYAEGDRLKGYTLSGELLFHDYEAMAILFGGTVIVGKAASAFVGKNMGWAAPNYTANPPTPVYLEVITKTAGQGVGDCVLGSTAFPTYVGHIFPRVRLVPGDRTFEADAANLTFTGLAENNPNMFDGPWNDYPGTGYMPNSPYIKVGYSTSEFNAIAALASCGYKTPSAAS